MKQRKIGEGINIPRTPKGCAKIYKNRLEKEEIGLVDCLQLGDKMTIFKKTDALFERTGFSSKNDWKSTMVKIENLRNNLSIRMKSERTLEKIDLAVQLKSLL